MQEMLDVNTGEHLLVETCCKKTVEYRYPNDFFVLKKPKEYKYANDFFAGLEPMKPLIHIYGASKNLNDIRNMVKKGILDQSLKSVHAITFMYMKLKNVREKLHSDWKSYNILIGAAGAEITPLSLLKVQEEQEGFPDGIQWRATENDDKWMCVYICAIYRLINAPSNAYRAVLINRIKQVLKEAGYRDRGVTLEPIFDSYSSWAEDPNYLKIVAAVDMFFYRFSRNEWRILRAGTTGSRYRDCAALTSLHHLVFITGISKNDEILEWAYTSRIRNDLKRILKPGEEINDVYSYLPYQVDLGLVPESPYSAEINVCFYFFSNAVAALLCDEQSINARMIVQADRDTVYNALIMGYVCGKEDFEDIDPENTPCHKNAKDWLIFMRGRHFTFTQKMNDYFDRVKSYIVAPKGGTIGAYLKAFL